MATLWRSFPQHMLRRNNSSPDETILAPLRNRPETVAEYLLWQERAGKAHLGAQTVKQGDCDVQSRHF